MHKWDEKVARIASALRKSESSPETDDTTSKDTLVPDVGNQRAYKSFLPKGGVHVAINLNNMRALNHLFSYQHGDDAVANVGRVLAETGHANKGKLFRTGGDEFRAHFDKPEQAYAFLRQASQGVGQLVPVGGHHRLSFSVGLGMDPQQADQALGMAKGARSAQYGHDVGHGQHFVHSLLPGAAGAVSVAEEPLIPEGFKLKQIEPIPMPTIP